MPNAIWTFVIVFLFLNGSEIQDGCHHKTLFEYELKDFSPKLQANLNPNNPLDDWYMLSF